MTDLFENPMTLDGFEFVEFSAPQKGLIERVFRSIGFTRVARHRSKNVTLWRQGNINLLTNYEPETQAAYFAQAHGPGACAMAFRVRNPRHAAAYAREQGAEFITGGAGPIERSLPGIRGIGGALIYLIDRDGGTDNVYDADFDYIKGVDRHPKGAGLAGLDHLAHNVYKGRIDYWAEYYKRLFNFRETGSFDIKGRYSGLASRVLTAPDGKIRIPINQEGADGKGQIEEYLVAYKGEGIQHIAFSCDDLLACWDKLKALGTPFITAPPETYFKMLDERLPDHGEAVEELRTRGILLDGSTEDGDRRLLLQIFSEKMIGPIFFEFIQRKKDEGFGEGNVKALFESIERDQINRGVLDTGTSA